jgi:hypothetical protein
MPPAAAAFAPWASVAAGAGAFVEAEIAELLTPVPALPVPGLAGVPMPGFATPNVKDGGEGAGIQAGLAAVVAEPVPAAATAAPPKLKWDVRACDGLAASAFSALPNPAVALAPAPAPPKFASPFNPPTIFAEAGASLRSEPASHEPSALRPLPKEKDCAVGGAGAGCVFGSAGLPGLAAAFGPAAANANAGVARA